MFRTLNLLVVTGIISLAAAAQTQPAHAAETPASATPPDWITISNGYAKMLTEVSFAHHPEGGSQQGLSRYDNKVSQPSLADEDQERQEREAVLVKLKAAAAEKQPEQVAEDLFHHGGVRRNRWQRAEFELNAAPFDARSKFVICGFGDLAHIHNGALQLGA